MHRLGTTFVEQGHVRGSLPFLPPKWCITRKKGASMTDSKRTDVAPTRTNGANMTVRARYFCQVARELIEDFGTPHQLEAFDHEIGAIAPDLSFSTLSKEQYRTILDACKEHTVDL
jgi:hypothetical protein